jgi:hypothetical protein
MSELVLEISGDDLSLREYLTDFEDRFSSKDNRACWKLERRQDFVEEGSDSYDAFRRGEWEQSLTLLEKRKARIRQYYADAAARGIHLYRVRVVERPISAYLVWQLNSLRQRCEVGEHTRVIGPEDVAHYEHDGVLPEIVGLGDDVAYRVIYDSTGAAERAIRSTNRSEITHWRRIFTRLYESGEDVGRFYDRHVVNLRP